MKFLFIHQNFPGQFLHLSRELVKKQHEVLALSLNGRRLPSTWGGVKIIEYKLGNRNGRDTFKLTTDFESKVIRASSCYSRALSLKAKGFSPDIIISHPGWGESLFIKQVWPEAILKLYCEFYYSPSGRDVGFDSEFEPSDPLYLPGVLLKNSNILLHSDQAHSCISPTSWQASTFPEHLRSKISVIHDGIDTDTVKPDDGAELQLNSGRKIKRTDEVVTFVSRSLEPYRGFHVFMRCLPALLEERKDLLILIVGEEGVSYGGASPTGLSWKKLFLAEITTLLTSQQLERIHFLGRIPYPVFKQVLCVSTVHVYLTYPFVLSWSLLEAMSSGCAIVASKTPPVEEVIINEVTGQLVDFFDYENLAFSVAELLENQDKRVMLGSEARKHIKQNYDLSRKCLPEQISWAEQKN